MAESIIIALPSKVHLGVEADSTDITTIEGVASPSGLHPIQQAFLENAALQCGICTPGILIAAQALLETNPDPTETEIRYYLAGNMCRCTGYEGIILAVEDYLRAGEDKKVPAREGAE